MSKEISLRINVTNLIHVFLEQRRNYKNVVDAFIRIFREEGMLTLWRGTVATMERAVVVNVSQLATYSQVKYLIASECMSKQQFP